MYFVGQANDLAKNYLLEIQMFSLKKKEERAVGTRISTSAYCDRAKRCLKLGIPV
jgi:hypothetical protein